MKYIELFAGIGGFRYGLEHNNSYKKTQKESDTQSWANCSNTNREPSAYRGCQSAFDCVWANEWNKYAAQVYRKHYGEIDTRDITTVNATEIPDHDLLTGGFPCQAFSVAGKRRGFKDTRGTLFFEIVRILEAKKPRCLLLENVKGLLSHDSGRTFQTVIGVLADLGYSVEWQVLNSKNFGVPQNRERVFIVGHLGGFGGGQVFPIRGQNETTLKELTKGQSQGMRVYEETGISQTLAGQAGGWGAKTGLYAVQDNKLKKKDVANTTDANYWKGIDNHQARTGVMQDMRIRRLTPTECERLQGFPDGWTERGLRENGDEVEISDTQRYKCLGNAVTTNVITEIGRALRVR